MERCNSLLYKNYINLKKRKFTEFEEINKKIASDLLQYQSDVEKVIESLKNENERLRVKIMSMEEECMESQKVLLLERSKKEALSDEITTLKTALAQKNGLEIVSGAIECFPAKDTPDTRQNIFLSVNAAIDLPGVCDENRIVFHDEPMNACLHAACCRRTKVTNVTEFDRSCNLCAFHTLVELLVGMKFSVECQTEGLCFSVIHQMSGYNFTLSLAGNAAGQEEELVYRVSSLGTIEKVALDWMKEDIIFSLAMFPVFFDRLSKFFGHK